MKDNEKQILEKIEKLKLQVEYTRGFKDGLEEAKKIYLKKRKYERKAPRKDREPENQVQEHGIVY